MNVTKASYKKERREAIESFKYLTDKVLDYIDGYDWVHTTNDARYYIEMVQSYIQSELALLKLMKEELDEKQSERDLKKSKEGASNGKG